MATEDLVFGFLVPRSADPLAVHDAMVRAAEYARSGLGGELLDADGRPFDLVASREMIQRVVERLGSAGFKPGSHSALILF